MNNKTDQLFVTSKTKKKHALQRQSTLQLGVAAALLVFGTYLCLSGPTVIGVVVVAAGGFVGGMGVSRLREATSIDDVFRG